MKPLEAVHDMERLCSQWIASPPEIKCLVLFALAEIDRQRAASRNPTLAAMMNAVPNKLMAEIVNDSRRVSAPSSLASTPDAPPQEPRRGTGWREDRGFPDRSREFEMMDRIVESQVGGPNDTRKLR